MPTFVFFSNTTITTNKKKIIYNCNRYIYINYYNETRQQQIERGPVKEIPIYIYIRPQQQQQLQQKQMRKSTKRIKLL